MDIQLFNDRKKNLPFPSKWRHPDLFHEKHSKRSSSALINASNISKRSLLLSTVRNVFGQMNRTKTYAICGLWTVEVPTKISVQFGHNFFLRFSFEFFYFHSFIFFFSKIFHFRCIETIENLTFATNHKSPTQNKMIKILIGSDKLR